MSFKDRVAIVTGGSMGAGLATARAFIQAGAGVAIMARNGERLQMAAEELRREGGIVHAVQGDVSSPADAARAVRETLDRLGRIDVLVNNAGIALAKKFNDTTTEEWDRVMAVNAGGVFHMTRETVDYMIKSQVPGRIVNVASISGKTGSIFAVPYSASKAAVIGFTKALAKELTPHGINVNCICPGAMDTEMFHKGTIEVVAEIFHKDAESIKKGILAAIPMKRLLDPKEAASLILYLASDEARGITGQAWDITCGLEIH